MTAPTPAPGELAGTADLPRQQLTLAFAPLHKAAFGTAVGVASGLLVFGVTAATLLMSGPTPDLQLLAVYFRGYSVSWPGAMVGAAWGWFVGFVFGWFAAFCRNLVLAVSIFLIRTGLERERTRDFLDHI